LLRSSILLWLPVIPANMMFHVLVLPALPVARPNARNGVIESGACIRKVLFAVANPAVVFAP
jgi:hypothetical protein